MIAVVLMNIFVITICSQQLTGSISIIAIYKRVIVSTYSIDGLNGHTVTGIVCVHTGIQTICVGV